MVRKWLLVTCLPLILLIGCSETQGILKGPVLAVGTPEQELPSVLANLGVIDVSLADLLDDPGVYKDQKLRVTGTFRGQQAVPCEGEIYPSPATWKLGSGRLEMQAAGPSDQVPDLTIEEAQIVVEGQWRRWVGLMGCGDEAKPAEVWYLETSNIIFPEEISLIQVGATPEQGPRTDDEGLNISPTISGIITATVEQSESPLLTVSGTPVQPAVGPPAPPATPAPALTPTFTQESVTAIPTATSTGGTDTPTPGLGTGTAVPTASGPSPTPGGTSSVVSMPTLNLGSLETSLLQDAENHLWPYFANEVQVITLQIAPEPDLGIAVSINNPSGQTIVDEGLSQAGQSIILTDIPLTEPGTYEILVSSSPGSSGDYAILVGDDESYNFVFRGFLDDGDSFSVEMDAESDHFWHFTGEVRQVIDIVVTPNNMEDLFLRLFGPDGSLLVEFYDLEAGGEAEQLLDYSLTASGLYSLLVGESDFETTEYTIEFSRS